MSAVQSFELVLLLLAIVIVLELGAERARMPPAAAFVLGGIVLALIPGTPHLELDPDLIMVLFLPPLLLSSAYFTVWRDFRANLRIILQLAVGAVAFTTAVVGVVAHWVVPDLPWAACFALGAIVSPPDAVAAKAVLARVRLPPRMNVLLEGESLVNDASGLVLYRFAVTAALTGAFSAGQAAVSFLTVSAGGVLTGIAVGYACTFVFARLHDARVSIIGSLLVSWAAYIGAEAMGVSGVLSVVATGLVMGWRQHTVLAAATRSQATAVWSVVEFAMESLIFILIGLSLKGVIQRLGASEGGPMHGLLHLGPAIAAIVLATVASRFAWMFPATYLPRLLFPRLRARDPYPPPAVPTIMSWAGMRGVVSLAAALALPEQFPGRDVILATTFAVILATVLVQGATLAPLIRWLRVSEFALGGDARNLTEERARARVVQAQLQAIQRVSAGPDGERHPRLVEQYTYRARAAERMSEATEEHVHKRAEHFRAVLAATAAGRAELLRMHRAGEIHDSVLHVLERELDLEEIRFAAYTTQEG